MGKYKFVKINYKGFGDWGWWLKIESVFQLYDWYFDTKVNKIGGDVCDFLSSKEFHYLVSNEPHCKNHFRTEYGQMLLYEVQKKEKANLSSLIDFLSHKIMDGKIESLTNGYILYINKVGGYAPVKKGKFDKFEEIDFVERDECIFPEYTDKDIRVFQWANGPEHWYAKIADVDVVINGEQKWNTYEQAKNNAIEFLKGL